MLVPNPGYLHSTSRTHIHGSRREETPQRWPLTSICARTPPNTINTCDKSLSPLLEGEMIAVLLNLNLGKWKVAFSINVPRAVFGVN